MTQDLKRAMQTMAAGPRTEAAVLAAYRGRALARARSRTRPFMALAAALAAAALIFTVAAWWRAGGAPPPQLEASIAPRPAPAIGFERNAPSAPLRRPARRPAPPAAAGPPPVEVATEFIPLPYAPPLAAAEGGHIVRVSVPRSIMRQLGVPVFADERAPARVPADVLLGEDGFARAVRFVRTSR